jgi:Amt family ammonium transporter
MTAAELKVGADTAWTVMTAFLVFFMNAGFGLVEAGLCRKKNAVMILSKNFVVFAISTLGFYFIGFGLMFSDGSVLGTAGGSLLVGSDNSPATGEQYSGSVNERMKYSSFLVFSVVLTALMYPVAGHWI